MQGAKDRRNFETWLLDHPFVARWVRQCVACGRRGMAADAPEKFHNRYWVQRLGTIRLDVSGLCEVCAEAQLHNPI
jgi:hypothetical protein